MHFRIKWDYISIDTCIVNAHRLNCRTRAQTDHFELRCKGTTKMKNLLVKLSQSRRSPEDIIKNTRIKNADY